MLTGAFREWVAPARLGLTAIPAGASSEAAFRLVIFDLNPVNVTGQYKSQQEFLIVQIEIFRATLQIPQGRPFIAMLEVYEHALLDWRPDLTPRANPVRLS